MSYHNRNDYTSRPQCNTRAGYSQQPHQNMQQLTSVAYAAYPSYPNQHPYTPTQQPYQHHYPTYTPPQSQHHHPMDYSQYGAPPYANSQYNYQQYPGYGQSGHAPAQPYEAPPQIRNPFVPPPPPRSQINPQNAQFDPVNQQEIAQWQSAYAPPDPYGDKKGGKKENPNLTAVGVRPAAAQENGAQAKVTEDGKKKTVVRKGGGETWEDDTLLEWDPSKFRIYVGNLAGEVTDDSLAKAFAAYDVNKARVIRDKRTTKSKGFGFVEFQDHELGFKAAREMVGKYVGSHPITIQKAKTDVHATVHKDRKGKNGRGKDKSGKSKDDPLRANTGAHIVKKAMPNPNIKLLG